MTTEYRRGIPSVAHVEAATRLGLEWDETRWTRSESRRWRFEMRDGDLWCDFMSDVSGWSTLETLSGGAIADRVDVERYSFRPIRTDGTPVDWEVLDAEAARASGPVVGTVLGINANGTVQVRLNLDGTVSPVAPEPRSFADGRPDRHSWRWWRVFGGGCNDEGNRLEVQAGQWRWFRMPRMPHSGWNTYLSIGLWTDRTVIPTDEQGNPVSWESIGQPTSAQPATVTTAPAAPTTQPQGFRADLWRRICENVRSASMLSLADVRDINAMGIEGRSAFHRADEYRYLWQGMGTTAEAEPTRQILTRWAVYQELKPLYDIVDGAAATGRTEPLPVDVFQEWARGSQSEQIDEIHSALRRDRAWTTSRMRLRLHNAHNCLQLGGPYCSWYTPSTGAVSNADPQEQKLANFAAVLDAVAEQRVAARVGQTQPVIRPQVQPPGVSMPIVPITAAPTAQGTWARQSEGRTLRPQPTQPTPLPRFTADELDDVDHSAATTQDSATLKRGKLPTVEGIGKYREVLAKRNGTVAEAVKASGINCEVAQYVLERWAGGLSDAQTQGLVIEATGTAPRIDRTTIDDRVQARLARRTAALDTSEPVDTEAQRQRAEAKERQARMAAVQAQLAAERAARIAEPQVEPTRFSLLEVDEAADPARSIEAWRAQRARNVVRPVAVPTPQPMPAPKRKPFEVVDAQADGLSGSAALAVLLGRAMNAEC